MCRKTLLHTVLTLVVLIDYQQSLYAQNDTLKTSVLDSFLLNQKGIVGKLAQNLYTDTAGNFKELQRVDEAFRPYRNRIIRNITIKSLEFGVSIGDTNRVLNNWLTRLANNLHWQTKEKEIKENLFFKQYDKLSPFILGDNERYLRDLPYLQNARIKVQPVRGSRDSVDIIVLTKDVISIGGEVHMHNTTKASFTIKEDNFYGRGDRLQLQMLYDKERFQKLGYGFEYIRRNIKGTFIDGALGYLDFDHAFSSEKAEERTAYIRISKQLVHPYKRWTYGLDARSSATRNMYTADSFYNANYKYKVSTIDAWGALNTSAGKVAGKNEENRLRTAVSARFFNQYFYDKPLRYEQKYYYRYADITAILGAVSLFRQNFYKVQYLYGFGRPEDVPHGVDATLTLGYTIKDARRRPYMSFNFERFYFTYSGNYFDYTLQAESFFHKRSLEDANLVGRMNFISHTNHIFNRWKQRTFINAELVTQWNALLNEPVYPHKRYGVMDIDHEMVGGNVRANLNVESAFYSPWSVLYFRMAPFVFGDASLFRYKNNPSTEVKMYYAIGGGLRIRNESLIFGTMELKAWYFPKKNFYNESTIFQFTTKLRFTYDQKLIRRPEFIQLN
jgi:hypothetical protein